MDKKNTKVIRITVWLGMLLASVYALATGRDAPAEKSVVILCVLGALGMILAMWELGWLRAPIPIGTPVKALSLVMAAILFMSMMGWYAWPTNKPPDTGPRTRAHIRVEEVQFGNASSFGVEAMVYASNIGAEPTADFTVVRGAIILAPLYSSAEQEDQLFKGAPFESTGNNSQSWDGSLIEKNNWYPGDPIKTLHLRYIDKLSDEDQKALYENATKVWYVVTVAAYRDKLGKLPVSESCWGYSPKTGRSERCWGHND